MYLGLEEKTSKKVEKFYFRKRQNNDNKISTKLGNWSEETPKYLYSNAFYRNFLSVCKSKEKYMKEGK